MIAGEQKRFLSFLRSDEGVRAGRIEVVNEVARLRLTVDRANVECVALRHLVFYLGGEFRLLQVVVHALTRIRMIESRERILEATKGSILRGRFEPGAATEIFSRGSEPKPITLKEPRVLLLRNGLGQRVRADRGQQIRQQILVHDWSFIAKIDVLRVSQFLVAVRQKEV